MTKKVKKRNPKTILKLPDLEHSKSAVLNSLSSMSSRRSYDHAIRDFIDWYCSEPRLSLTELSSLDTGSPWSSAGMLRRRSIFDSPRYADWHTGHPTAGCLVPTWPLVYGE